MEDVRRSLSTSGKSQSVFKKHYVSAVKQKVRESRKEKRASEETQSTPTTNRKRGVKPVTADQLSVLHQDRWAGGLHYLSTYCQFRGD